MSSKPKRTAPRPRKLPAKPSAQLVRASAGPVDEAALERLMLRAEQLDADPSVDRSDGQPVNRLDGQPAVAGVKQLRGYQLADGTRRGAKTVSRLELLPPPQWKALVQEIARKTGRTSTEVIMDYCARAGLRVDE